MQFLDSLRERPPAPPRSFYIQGVTADGKLAAHYENTILVTDGEPEILTVTERQDNGYL